MSSEDVFNEQARQLSQALANLPADYPWKDQADYAYGFLVLGRLKLRPERVVIAPTTQCKWTKVELVS